MCCMRTGKEGSGQAPTMDYLSPDACTARQAPEGRITAQAGQALSHQWNVRAILDQDRNGATLDRRYHRAYLPPQSRPVGPSPQFTHYKHEPAGPAKHQFRFCDHPRRRPLRQTMWIGTHSNGLNLYDKTTTVFPAASSTTTVYPQSIISNTIRKVLVDKQGLAVGRHTGRSSAYWMKRASCCILTSKAMPIQNSFSHNSVHSHLPGCSPAISG
jgi:hypothetical protein